jgi:hypothetical protein
MHGENNIKYIYRVIFNFEALKGVIIIQQLFFQNRLYRLSHKEQCFASIELVFSHLMTFNFTASDKLFPMHI